LSFISYPFNRTEELPKQSLHRSIVLHLFRLGAISAPFMGNILFRSTTNQIGLVRLVRQDAETQAEILRNQESALHGCITLTRLDPLPPFPTLQDDGDFQHA